jgi:peptidoglycan/LPS O-acetylase OafA/YrhL
VPPPAQPPAQAPSRVRPAARAHQSGEQSLAHHAAIDGIRALAVLAVLFYHAGFDWAGGGFLGVDVFFVLSGFLITGILLGEWQRTGTIGLLGFYRRRARRLLPALFLLLLVVVGFVAIVIPGELARLRGDVLAALTYVTNWFLIVNQQSYFQALGRPSLLQHLWSLAIEEQYYVVWPLALLVLARLTSGRTALLFGVVAAGAVASTAWMWILYQPFEDPSRVYYGTDTRAASLLIGSALAIAWPAITRRATGGVVERRVVDVVAFAALAGLAFLAVNADPAGDFLYQGGFAIVAIIAAALIAAVTHPSSRIGRAVLGHPILSWLGLRSYAIYLWHWPIFMVTRAQLDVPIDELPLFALRLGLTLLAADLSFRFVENPIRHGALGRWWAGLHEGPASYRARSRQRGLLAGGALLIALVLSSTALLSAASNSDIAGLPPGVLAPGPSDSPAMASDGPSVAQASVAPTASPSGHKLPVGLLLVGDSQANMLALNAPGSVKKSFKVTDGWLEGCGILSDRMISRAFRRNMAECSAWTTRWTTQAGRSKAPITLVVLGAWDVFDLQVNGQTLAFGSAAWDAHWTAQLAKGIQILRNAGTQVALLGIPCYRPISSGGQTALPERGNDSRTRHLDVLLKAAAAADPAHVFYIEPPIDFCTNQKIATDVYYRWDGVHYGGLGAALVFKDITKQLLAIPRR